MVILIPNSVLELFFLHLVFAVCTLRVVDYVHSLSRRAGFQV